MNRSAEVVIIGAGLSGLLLAQLLTRQGMSVIVLEASDRLGGRIQTITGATGLPMELGATWFSDMHPELTALATELGLKKFPQYARGRSLFQTKSFEPAQEFDVPENETQSFRFVDGTASLITAIAGSLPPGVVQLGTPVRKVTLMDNSLAVSADDDKEHVADYVVSCIPPQLFDADIQTFPSLPSDLSALLRNVQTWMAGSIKFALEYSSSFWREKGFSGMLYSHAGIITEMYDHSTVEGDRFGFTGFLNGGAAAYKQDVRRELVLQQLNGLFGVASLNPVSYIDKVWTDAFIVNGQTAFARPHQNNGHALLQQVYMDGRLHFCGTESATECGGYMEGALVAAQSVASRFSRLPKRPHQL